ncbi:MAG: C_GCAxxG_C_C family protein [Lachnospiraceae bacterium]|nr:C_GCAxxG_C_C family protein [Lachnospiraceae bacterium]
MTHKEKALQYFSDKFHCSQAVLAAFAPESGITEEQALKLGACFGSGMRKGEVCGACTGALMVLGLMYGQFNKDDVESRMRANKVNVEMMNGFAEKSGSYICNELLGCDIRTEEGIRYARENDLFTDFCPKMVANAVDVLEEIIRNNGEKDD